MTGRAKRLVDCCASVGYNLINICAEEGVVGCNTLTGTSHIHAHKRGVKYDDEPKIHGSPAIWRLTEECGYKSSCGNSHQRQVRNADLAEKGVYIVMTAKPRIEVSSEVSEYLFYRNELLIKLNQARYNDDINLLQSAIDGHDEVFRQKITPDLMRQIIRWGWEYTVDGNWPVGMKTHWVIYHRNKRRKDWIRIPNLSYMFTKKQPLWKIDF